jgi:hypothetical protein
VAPGVGFASEWIPDGPSHPFPRFTSYDDTPRIGLLRNIKDHHFESPCRFVRHVTYPELSRLAGLGRCGLALVVSRRVVGFSSLESKGISPLDRVSP